MAFFLFIIISIIILFAIYTILKYRNFPPGPYGVPILGYLPFLKPKTLHLQITDLGKKYGKIFSLNFGLTPIVILNNMETIREAFIKNSDTFSGRPKLFIFDAMFNKKDIITTDGKVWKEQRKLTQRYLRESCVGRSSMESLIMVEIEKLIEQLEQNENRRVNITGLFTLPLIHVLLKIICGEHFDTTPNEELSGFKDAFHNFADILSGSSIINYFPFLRFVIPEITGYNNFLLSNRIITNFMWNTVNRHEETFNRSYIRDFIDAYLKEIQTKLQDAGEQPPYQKEHLVCTIYNLILAGVETTDTTLCWAILQMAHRPDIQQKLHQELDAVLEKDQLPSTALRGRMPYLEATLLEVHRYFSIVQLGVPHSTTNDVKFLGYELPKHTWVMANMWAVHHDPINYTNPESFCPERFLDNDGNVVEPDHLIPFSTGPRICLGKSFAKTEVFLFFSCLMHKFKFEIISNECKPSLEPIVGITLRPKPYSLLVTCRS